MPKSPFSRYGLTQTQARQLSLRSLSKKETAGLASNLRPSPSLHIPYFALDGSRTPFFRVRYLDDLAELYGKYGQPPSALPRAYFPKVLPWRKIAKSPNLEIWITEGEFKAACAAVRKIPTIGLGGVWNWRSARAGIDFLADLEAIQWDGRSVVLCFDSDVIHNPQVRSALRALSQELAKRGAQTFEVRLPEKADEKVGLDDYLIEKGVQSLRKEERVAVQTATVEERQMLDRWVFVEGNFYDLVEQKLILKRQKFLDKVKPTKILGGDGKPIGNPGLYWLSSSERQEADGVRIYPGSSKRIVDEEGRRFINDFPGFKEPQKGSVAPMLELVRRCTGDHSEVTKAFLAWMAWPFHHPEAPKVYWAPFVFRNVQGCGKSAMGYVLMDIYGTSCRKLTDRSFFGQWNDWAERTLLGFVDDVRGDATAKCNAQLKQYLGGETVEVLAKFRDQATVVNRTNFYFTANGPGALPVDANENRRILFLEFQNPAPRRFMEGRFDRWRANGGAARWLYYLLTEVDLSDFSPRTAPPRTEAEHLTVESATPAVEQWVLRHMGPGGKLHHDALWTTGQVFDLYKGDPHEVSGQVTKNAVTRALAKAGARRLGIYLLGGALQPLWSIREHRRWADGEKARLAWKKRHPTA